MATRLLPSPSPLVRRQRANPAAALFARCGALVATARSYFWPFNEDFVPRGAATSGFQSSASPNMRQRVLQEYALSPLFGARVPCCTLGSMRSAREMVGVKKEVALLLCELARLRAGAVSLGPLVQTTEMMLFKPDTPLSPRLGDDRSRRMHTYARKPIAARTLMDVFLPEEIALDEVVAIGRLVQEKLLLARRDADGGDAERGGGAGCGVAGGMQEAQVLVGRMGIVYCELPPLDEGGFMFDAVGGVSLDADEAERVVQRWHERGESQARQSPPT
ncbi:uncharacterized protein Tco025E_05908 [Trypanosoma conorhini]|uniref:Uncharacterized protein n=1 Tax=Trypanosoma conorhini TaxID=83891 RepID=A0A3R7MFF6_9TRYP|nr:uncharacterized protein Tco025E_05908 [Trypanosoma conorhini]RNF14221.1 hypothetical protein Tco025E_05908 [Trypanosoma conorhini]